MSPGVAVFVVASTVGVLSMASLARPATTPVARAAAACNDYEAQADAQRATDTRDPDGDGIYCGDESPRIVTAEVVGSRGVTEIDGATLRAKLGLTDSWASFVSISARKGPEFTRATFVRVPVGRDAARNRDRPAAWDQAARAGQARRSLARRGSRAH